MMTHQTASKTGQGNESHATQTPLGTNDSALHEPTLGASQNRVSLTHQGLLHMQHVSGNDSVLQMVSLLQDVRQGPGSTASPSTNQVIQRWKAGDSEGDIIDEILSKLEDPSTTVDRTHKRLLIDSIYNRHSRIAVDIQLLSEAEHGQPVFISRGPVNDGKGVKSYILYIAETINQEALLPLLRSALRQIQDWASETPGWFDPSEAGSKRKTGSESGIPQVRSGVRTLEDRVVQSIQTDIPESALWSTLVDWLPHLEEHPNAQALSVQFASLTEFTASELKLTLASSTRFLAQLSEFYLRFHKSTSEREHPDMPTGLINHLNMVTEKTKQSRERYMASLKEKATNTDTDFEKAKKKRRNETPPVPVPLLVKKDDPIVETPLIDKPTTASDESSSTPIHEDTNDAFLEMLMEYSDYSDEVVVEKKPEEEFPFLFEHIDKKHHTDLEKEIKEQKPRMGNVLRQLNLYINGELLLGTFLANFKKSDDKKYLIAFKEKFDVSIDIPDTFLEKPVKKLELRDTLPTKKTIDNAVDAFFITKLEAGFLVRTLGFHTAARLISYYRKNNAMAAIRGLIDQLRDTLANVNTAANDDEQNSPLSSESLILDTNIAKALLLADADMNPEELQVKRKTMELLNGRTVKDIRLPNMVIGELVQFGTRVFEAGSKKTPSIPWKPMPITGKRDGSNHQGQYAADLLMLEQRQVGGSKGAPDRQLVVDSLHALTQSEATEVRLITADKGITKHLYEMYLEQEVKKKEKEKEIGKGSTGLPDGSAPSLGSSTAIGEAVPDVEVPDVKKYVSDKPFILELGGRKLTIIPVDATVKEEDKTYEFYKPDGAKADPIVHGSDSYNEIVVPNKGPAATLFGKPIGKKDSTVTVKDLIELVSANQYDIAFVGGSVRDSLRGESPKDIDVTTNMDIDSLVAMLIADERFSNIPRNVVKTDKLHLVQLAIQTEFSIDITCVPRERATEVRSFADSGFYEKDAKKRDFSMNSLYIDKTGKLHDPTGRGVADTLSKNLYSLERSFVEELFELMSFNRLGRLLKFSARNYHIADEQLQLIRKRIVELISNAHNDKDTRAVKMAQILDQARERTPAELIQVMRDLGFSDKLIRQLFPDSPSGFFEDGTPSYRHSIIPGRLDNPQTSKLPDDGLPDVKYDTESGRLYQYRMFVKDQDEENLMVDMDLTEHGMAGHTSPHYHLYRWIDKESGEGEWDKHSQGMSATGEPGRPAIENSKYVGPRPWRWTENLKDEQPVEVWIKDIQTQMQKDGIAIEITNAGGDMLSFAGEIRIHVNKIRELKAKNKLDELLMFVYKISEKGKLPYTEDMSSISLISSGGERLRFRKHQFEISEMLTHFDIEERPVQDAHWIRLFDLLHYMKSDIDAVMLKSAAKWARSKAGFPVLNWTHFVEFFEFYLASSEQAPTAVKATADSAVDSNEDSTKDSIIEAEREKEVNVAYTSTTVSVSVGEQLSHHANLKQSLKEHGREIKALAANGKIGFISEPSAKYHYIKHSKGIQQKTGSTGYGFEQYLNSALETIESGDMISDNYEQLGTQQFVFIKNGNKAIVRVELDDTAHLATFYDISKKDTDMEDAKEYAELVETSATGRMERDGVSGSKEASEINQLFGSLEYFIQSAQAHVYEGSQELADRQAKAAGQILSDIIIPMFYAKLDRLEPNYVVNTIKRIISFRNQVDFLENLGGKWKEQQAIEALIEKIERESDLLSNEILEVTETLKKAALPESTKESLDVQSDPRVRVTILGEKLHKMESELLNNREELKKLKLFANTVPMVVSSSSVSAMPQGLLNVGNSCYIGSIMQMMASNSTFTNLFMESPSVSSTSVAANTSSDVIPPSVVMSAAVRELQLSGRAIMQKLLTNGLVLEAEILAFRKALLRNGWINGNVSRIASQQDAAELLLFLTDKLNFNDQVKVRTTYALNDGEEQVDSKEAALVLNQIEEGMDLNQLVELNTSSMIERFRDESNVQSNRKFTSLPNVLTIQLARFTYSRELQRVVKIDTTVPVPDRELTINPACIENGTEAVKYELNSFILHLGASPDSGHYVGYFRKNNQWYGFNDSLMRVVSPAEVDIVSRHAYLLSFTKRTG
ncbi:hypothetical protein [Paenibacillus sp. 481]|uniref:hypothetical protein n=1 Tax=Paenibacillus sp. 481 TaxID=2835869 RepID=UPI001E575EC3|nr:hypothetical protein [Paenibacillus sp. 481]UHA73454.1 hypothetical protein KIK04_23325 [Paenibacillus sp. 481]